MSKEHFRGKLVIDITKTTKKKKKKKRKKEKKKKREKSKDFDQLYFFLDTVFFYGSSSFKMYFLCMYCILSPFHWL